MADSPSTCCNNHANEHVSGAFTKTLVVYLPVVVWPCTECARLKQDRNRL